MKTSFLVITLVINSIFPTVFAVEKAVEINTSQEVFNSKWNFSPLVKRTEGKTTVQTKMFQRLLWIEKRPVSVVDTNFVFLKNPTLDIDPKKNELTYIAQSMKKSFGGKLKVTGNATSMVVEGKFEKLNRYIKVNLQKKNDNVTIITSFARMGLYKNLEAEVLELHEILLKYDGVIPKENAPKTTWMNWLGIESAHADGFGINLSNLLGGMNTGSGASGSGFSYNLTGNFSGITDSVQGLRGDVTALGNSVNGQLGVANGNWGNTNNQLGNANVNWGNTNYQLGSANQNWRDTNNQIDKFNSSLDNANLNWADTNKEITRANNTAEKLSGDFKDMNSNWAESNKILAKATDPNHMAKVGFYTAAGAALGGVAVNLAIQGVSEGISFLHELFTGAKKKKLEWDDFEKAMQVWDTQLNDLVKMEQVVDNYLAAFEFFEGKNVGNDYVKQLNIAMRDMRFDRDVFMEKFKDQNMDIECRKMFYNAADELDQKLKEYDKVIQFATNNNVSITEGPAYFCNQLKELQRKILGAETQMQDLRLKILVAENQYYGKQLDSIEKRDEEIGKVNDRIANTLEEKKAFDKKIMDRIQQTHKQTKEDWFSACMDGKNEEGKLIKEELTKTFFLFAYFKKRSRCNDTFANIEETLKKRDEASVRAIAAEEIMRKDLVVRANNTVEMKLSEEQMSWMSRIHMDAYCYQYAHQPKDKMPAKCSEFPEVLYSTSLSKGYEKAKNAYTNKCQDRYLRGLANLSSGVVK